MSNRNNVAGERNRRRDCDFVFECLLDLLEDVLGENNNHRNHCSNWNENVAGESNRRVRDCEDVFECLEELLEDALGENNKHCRKH